ncbi:hypothetical protein Tco_0982708, partial [Tanacetum coccineum]
PVVTPSMAPVSTPTPALITRPSSPTRLQQPSEDAISRLEEKLSSIEAEKASASCLRQHALTMSTTGKSLSENRECKSTKLAPDGIVWDEIFTTAVRLTDITMRNNVFWQVRCSAEYSRIMIDHYTLGSSNVNMFCNYK